MKEARKRPPSGWRNVEGRKGWKVYTNTDRPQEPKPLVIPIISQRSIETPMSSYFHTLVEGIITHLEKGATSNIAVGEYVEVKPEFQVPLRNFLGMLSGDPEISISSQTDPTTGETLSLTLYGCRSYSLWDQPQQSVVYAYLDQPEKEGENHGIQGICFGHILEKEK